MSERWVPVLAAIVGVLGGMGGAYVGGSVANEGEQQRFENAQRVRMLDLRRNVYVDFLRASSAAQFASEAEGAAAFDKLKAAEANVELFANAEVRDAARGVVDGVQETGVCERAPSGACYEKWVDRFLVAAKAELQAGE
ncbi:MAG: hypothetical protein M3322_13875 [Actinomycetota bacterium]|nr:hypothetical protein [Actinomycetota bacterium]